MSKGKLEGKDCELKATMFPKCWAWSCPQEPPAVAGPPPSPSFAPCPRTPMRTPRTDPLSQALSHSLSRLDPHGDAASACGSHTVRRPPGCRPACLRPGAQAPSAPREAPGLPRTPWGHTTAHVLTSLMSGCCWSRGEGSFRRSISSRGPGVLKVPGARCRVTEQLLQAPSPGQASAGGVEVHSTSYLLLCKQLGLI